MQAKYWLRVAGLAWSKTIQALGLDSRGRVVTAFLTALTAAAVLLFWGSQDAAGDMALERGAIWALAVLVFPFLYVWYFVTTPAKIDDEIKGEIGSLREHVAKAATALVLKAVSRQSVLTLSLLLERGYEISVERISLDQFERWLEKLNKWEVLTLRYIATNFSHQEAVSFKNVLYSVRENFIFKVSEDHNKGLQQLTTRLNTLRGIVARHQKDWSPISPADRDQIEAVLAVFDAQIAASDSGSP